MQLIEIKKPILLPFIAYLVIIFVCAFFYYGFPDLFKKPLSFIDSLYFSVVTITTLGYGDISPVSELGKFIAAAEALFGVILIGLFLLAVSKKRKGQALLKR